MRPASRIPHLNSAATADRVTRERNHEKVSRAVPRFGRDWRGAGVHGSPLTLESKGTFCGSSSRGGSLLCGLPHLLPGQAPAACSPLVGGVCSRCLYSPGHRGAGGLDPSTGLLPPGVVGGLFARALGYFSRRPSYHISNPFRFRTAPGPRKRRPSMTKMIWVAVYILALRPEERTGSRMRTNRPSRLSAHVR